MRHLETGVDASICETCGPPPAEVVKRDQNRDRRLCTHCSMIFRTTANAHFIKIIIIIIISRKKLNEYLSLYWYYVGDTSAIG